MQLEEVFARVTVAITRARSLCIIMGSLDVKGLLGAATVVGALVYGAGCGPDLLTSTCMTALFKVHRLTDALCKLSLEWIRLSAALLHGGPQGLCPTYLQSAPCLPHCGRSVSPMEVQCEERQANHRPALVRATKRMVPFMPPGDNAPLGAVDMCMTMPLTTLSFHATWFGRCETGTMVTMVLIPRLRTSLR